MKPIIITTNCKQMLADVHTPVGIYLRLRDRFRDTILLESADSHAGNNSYSIIGVNAIAGIEVFDKDNIEFKLPGLPAESLNSSGSNDIPAVIWDFMKRFELAGALRPPASIAQGLFGYAAYEAAQFFDNGIKTGDATIPLMRYRLYQYVIIIDHHRDELFLCENQVNNAEGNMEQLEQLIRHRDIPEFPFNVAGEEMPSVSDERYLSMVEQGIQACQRGDTFQVVLSRGFRTKFTGDDFNVYRALRSVSPSPYLFYFDYGDYKLMGSSPEAQLQINGDTAVMHPIAGTVKRTGDDERDQELANQLRVDEKENAEHVMLVDLARNDLSRIAKDVQVTEFKKLNYYSHVIHLVSEVSAKIPAGSNPLKVLGAGFPAGTLSGAPKIRAMQLIREQEQHPRGFYGGAIGSIGFNGDCNHAIMIRSLMCRNNTLHYQAGAGVVALSKPVNELNEVNNKLSAIRQAIEMAENI